MKYRVVAPPLRIVGAYTRYGKNVRDFLDAFRTAADWVDPDATSLAQALASGLRDPNDVPVLALAIASGADGLITGDKDLLALASSFPILTPTEFCARHAP